jgi:hypothetical protein
MSKSLETKKNSGADLPRSPNGAINVPVGIKGPDGSIVGQVNIPLYPDGTTNRVGVAKYFGCHTRTVDKWIAGGKVPYERRTARSLRFHLEKVAKALSKNTVEGKG